MSKLQSMRARMRRISRYARLNFLMSRWRFAYGEKGWGKKKGWDEMTYFLPIQLRGPTEKG